MKTDAKKIRAIKHKGPNANKKNLYQQVKFGVL
jgi:hypothetical protein